MPAASLLIWVKHFIGWRKPRRQSLLEISNSTNYLRSRAISPQIDRDLSPSLPSLPISNHLWRNGSRSRTISPDIARDLEHFLHILFEISSNIVCVFQRHVAACFHVDVYLRQVAVRLAYAARVVPGQLSRRRRKEVYCTLSLAWARAAQARVQPRPARRAPSTFCSV